MGIATFLLIISLGRDVSCGLTRVLTHKYLLFVGSISYSTYLAHPLAIRILEPLFNDLSWSSVVEFILVFLFTVLFSFGTYHLIEVPTNRFGRNLVLRGRSSGAPQQQARNQDA